MKINVLDRTNRQLQPATGNIESVFKLLVLRSLPFESVTGDRDW